MYLALKHSHLLTAVLSVVLTLAWTLVAWKDRPAAPGGPTGGLKATYVVHRIVAGLAGLTGLAVTFVGPWQAMIFPYVGLAAFLVHGFAAGVSKTSFGVAAEGGKRKAMLLIQIAALLLSAWVMAAKPF